MALAGALVTPVLGQRSEPNIFLPEAKPVCQLLGNTSDGGRRTIPGLAEPSRAAVVVNR